MINIYMLNNNNWTDDKLIDESYSLTGKTANI